MNCLVVPVRLARNFCVASPVSFIYVFAACSFLNSVDFASWVVLPAAARISPIVLFAAAFSCASVLISENFRILLLMLWFGYAETKFLPLIIVSIKTIPQHTITEDLLVLRKIERFSPSNPFKCTVSQAEELETTTINVVVFHPINRWTFLFAVHSYMYMTIIDQGLLD
jgi:hypothetical protein